MNDIFSRAGAQTVNQPGYQQIRPNYHNPAMDPSEFTRFMQQSKEQPVMKNDSHFSVNSAQVKNKEDYARILKHQIEEKKTLKQLQDSPNRNYYKVTGYHPSMVEQTLHQSKQLEIQAQIEQQQLRQYPVSYQSIYQQPYNDSQAAMIQNNNKQDQPKNVRGMFAREMYQTNEQAAVKDAKNQALRSDLLKQIDDKRAIKDLERQKQDIEDIIYMDKMKQQQLELGLKPDNERQNSSLRQNNKIQEPQVQLAIPIKELKKQQTQESQIQMGSYSVVPQIAANTGALQQGSFQGGPKYNYTPIFIPPSIREQNVNNDPQIEQLKERLQSIIERQPQQVINYAQSEVNYDFMKQNYHYQQVEFNRDMSTLKDQLTRADLGRLNAEKELLTLQEKAREKRVWNILDNENDAFMPNQMSRDKGIFRTAKYAMGNLSEAERRQKILQDYYQQDRNNLSLGPLTSMQYPQSHSPNYDEQQLETETRMIIAQGPQSISQPNENSKKKLIHVTNYVFYHDQDLEKQIIQINNHDKLVQTHTHQNSIGEYIKDPQLYNQMLEQNSLLEIIAAMKLNGDKKVMTPLPTKQRIQDQELQDNPSVKRQKSQGDQAVALFIQDLPQPDPKNTGDQQQILQDDKSQQSSVYDYPEVQAKTEDLLESPQFNDVPPAPKMKFGWEVDFIDDTQSEVDPIDQKIGGMLDNIETIVNRRQNNDDYFSFQTKMRVQTISQSNLKLRAEDQRKRFPHWKPITFEKNSETSLNDPLHQPYHQPTTKKTQDLHDPSQTLPHSSNKTQAFKQQQQFKQKQQQSQPQKQMELDQGIDHIDRIDSLLKQFAS